jgi:hypothetical protein
MRWESVGSSVDRLSADALLGAGYKKAESWLDLSLFVVLAPEATPRYVNIGAEYRKVTALTNHAAVAIEHCTVPDRGTVVSCRI